MIVVIKDLYTLKSWEDQDTESLAFHLNNKKIWDNCRDGLPYPYTKGNARFFIKQAQEKTDISDFCITVGGEAIGNIGFVRGTDVERFNAEVGYWISEKYWNQGIVSDALTEAIQRCTFASIRCGKGSPSDAGSDFSAALVKASSSRLA